MAMVALLLTLALPRYFQSIDVSKETILVENLRVTRDAIDKFYGDKGRYPGSLDELVESKYLRSVPFDPFTKSAETWILVFEEEGEGEEEEPGPPPIPGEEGEGPGVIDVRSGSNRKSLDGTPYSSW